jgi:hypothetical protein
MSLINQFKEQFAEQMNAGSMLVPPGTYQAVFVGYDEDADNYRIILKFTLQNNPGMEMPDGTPVDGTDVYYNVWLPKPGDENIPSKRGSKATVKISMANRVWKALGWDPRTGDDLGVCLGSPVLLDIINEEYNEEMQESVSRVKPLR